MKVLQVNCVYKKGSTGKITYDLHKGLLDAGIESIVCYGRGELVDEPGVYKTCPEWYSKLNNALSRITGIMYGGCFFSTNRLISIIKKEKPDVVHLQCINGYFVNIYRLVSWLKKNHVKTVLTPHAEFMYSGNCFLLYAPEHFACYQYLKKNNAAYTASNIEQLKKILSELVRNSDSRTRYQANALDLARKNHDILINNKKFQSILCDAVK